MNQSSDSPISLPIFLTPLQITASVIFAISSFLGLLVYILVLSILIGHFHRLKSNFYCIVVSLSITDVSFLALILFYAVPCTILQRGIWTPYDPIAGIIEGLAYNSQGVHLIFIAINRLAYSSVSTPTPQHLEKIFNRRGMVAFWIALIWTLSLVITLPIKLHGCELLYHYDALNFIPNCLTRAASVANLVISGALPITVTFLHLVTWLIVYAKGKRAARTNQQHDQLAQRRSREKRILIQFTLISIAMLTFWGSFWIFPKVLPGNAGAFVVITFGIINCTVNPLTYLKFNKIVKAKAEDLIRKTLMKIKGNTVVVPAYG